jgi:dGTPase
MKNKFIIFKYYNDVQAFKKLNQKLNRDPDQQEKYYYNKLPFNLNKNEVFDIIIASISRNNSDNNRLFIGSAESYLKNKLKILNTYEINESQKESLVSLYKQETNDDLFKVMDKENEAGKQFIFIQKLDRINFNRILNEDLNSKPNIPSGDYITFKNTKKSDIIKNIESGLNKLAQRSRDARRAVGYLEPNSSKSEFEEDKDRIVHSRAFRRLVGKAQVYNTDKGDHYRTRMTHSLEVNQIAKSIARALNLNQDLTEAIALGHDIGHTPFGHQGERQLDRIYKNVLNLDSNKKNIKHNYQSIKVLNYLEEKFKEFPGLDLTYQVYEGILKHTNYKLCGEEKKCSECRKDCIANFLIIGDSEYLYLDYNFSTTLEGQIIYWADEIAQAEHDLDDGLSNGNINLDRLDNELGAILDSYSDDSGLEKKQLNKLKKIVSECNKYDIGKHRESENEFIDKKDIVKSEIVLKITDFFINELIINSEKNISKYLSHQDPAKKRPFIDKKVIGFNTLNIINDKEKESNVLEMFNELISSQMLNSYEVNCFDGKAKYIIRKLFDAYYTNPLQLPDNTLKRIDREIKRFDKSWENIRTGKNKTVKKQLDICNGSENSFNSAQDNLKQDIFIRTILDFIAGMTDDFANGQFNKLYMP